MAKSYEYQTPEKGATDWHQPLNRNFARIGAHLAVLNWRLSDLGGIHFHHKVSGGYRPATPQKGATDWHVPLNDNFE